VLEAYGGWLPKDGMVMTSKGWNGIVATNDTEWWLPVDGVTWDHPEGPQSDVFMSNRSNHPVVQVGHHQSVGDIEGSECQFPRGSDLTTLR